MREAIPIFLENKSLSENSRASYTYDLEQFVKQTDGQITETKLQLYRAFMKDLKPSVQKRKISSVNQFLFFLYQEKYVATYHRLTTPKSLKSAPVSGFEMLDLSSFWERSSNEAGRLMALMILELGLLPTEILSLKTSKVSMDFQILTIEKAGQRRVLELTDELSQALSPYLTETYLLDNKGSTYSRQWGFRQLESFLLEKGETNLSAQKLREQYILRQLDLGRSLHDIAKNLGLKSITTLEKYRDGYKN
ncbi:site-specific tyrosine recombinase XerD [Streptococcus sp. DD10]|uniref:site-specific tyrosine recombinase XerD n=1 Tax=Streptococcus sp. DD10 TaxID=1777878 RepID=UPI0008315BF0|nr:site-specific tyrosine recombinase XerD [Streptococcus sp. DD10]